MLIVRYRRPVGGPTLAGLLVGGAVVPLGERLSALWQLPAGELHERLDAAATAAAGAVGGPSGTRASDSAAGEVVPVESVELVAPIDGRTEVWACGVTYEISREARVEESEHDADIYRRVYDAERPELFFKAVSWRVSGDGEAIAIRSDSAVDVPEPELALVCNCFGEIVGYSICNDVSSRSIEGENPLYLPQAKCYLGSCALGPGIRPSFEIPDPYALSIAMAILRDGEEVWSGTTPTRALHRRLEELVEHLFRSDRHPDGAVLSTGTCLVPEAPFTLGPGDVVKIAIDGIGTLQNPVLRGLDRLPTLQHLQGATP